MEMVLDLTTFKCKRCFALNQEEKCRCGHSLFTEELLSRKEYCKKFGHVQHSPYECLGCGEKFKHDPLNLPIESVGCGNCKKENDRPEDWHDDCLKY